MKYEEQQQCNQSQRSEVIKDQELKSRHQQGRSELIRSISPVQINSNIDNNCISPQLPATHKGTSPLHQSLTRKYQKKQNSYLEQSHLEILKVIKTREPENKRTKIQKYAGIIEVTDKFHNLMEPTIQQEKIRPKVLLPGQYIEYPNKDGQLFFYPFKTTTRRLYQAQKNWIYPKRNGKNLKEMGVKAQSSIVFDQATTSKYGQISQKDHKSREYQIIDQIASDGTEENICSDQSEITIVYITNENDGLGKIVYRTQFKAAVNCEANPEISHTKISIYTSFHNVNGPDGLGGNGCGTQLKAITNDNESVKHQAIDINNNTNDKQQTIDNRIERIELLNGTQNINLTIHGAKLQRNRISDLLESEQFQTNFPKHVSEIADTSQPKSQPPLIIKYPVLNPVKGKVIDANQRVQLIYENDTRSKISLQTTTSNKPSRSSKARANTDSTNHFTIQQEQRKRETQSQILNTRPTNSPEATRPVDDPRNRNKDSKRPKGSSL
ncbi:MAG: hypothetical protein EZS28_014937 [Streblomastix strix]|uniref:Uncharacterized protein n=1 Tax=Streblomastix strix TaxID=222440 RepID=A0A5J4W424_9EUKA|nr:MAG: hypothetical protein EZS28_014937 [Streblomastix strix]